MFERDLRVPELTDVEVVGLGCVVSGRLAQPSEEDVARGLHQPLSLDHSLPLVGELGPAGEALEYGRRRLLCLEEQRIARVGSDQQDYPAARSHASYADDLACEVGIPIVLQQLAAVTGQAAEVGPRGQPLARVVLEPARSAAVDEVRNRHDQRGVGPDAQLAVVLNGELRECAGAVFSPALRDRLVEPLDLASVALRAQ